MLEGMTMVRRVDPNGEALVCCRKCSGHARRAQKPAASQNMDTRVWEDVKKNLNTRRGRGARQKRERVESWEGRQKRRVTGKECNRVREEFEVGGFMARKGLWNLAQKRMLEDRGALRSEGGDLLREYQAMHEENFLLSCWLREDVEGKEEDREKMNKEAEEEESKRGKGCAGREGRG